MGDRFVCGLNNPKIQTGKAKRINWKLWTLMNL